MEAVNRDAVEQKEDAERMRKGQSPVDRSASDAAGERLTARQFMARDRDGATAPPRAGVSGKSPGSPFAVREVVAGNG